MASYSHVSPIAASICVSADLLNRQRQRESSAASGPFLSLEMPDPSAFLSTSRRKPSLAGDDADFEFHEAAPSSSSLAATPNRHSRSFYNAQASLQRRVLVSDRSYSRAA